MQKIAQGLSDFFSQLIRRYAPAIITALLLAGAFFFYSNVIIAKNERTMKERSFRGLNRIADNIRDKVHNYSTQNSANFLREINRETLGRPAADARVLHIREEYGLKEIKIADTSQNNNTQKDIAAPPSFSMEFHDDWQVIFNSARYPNQKAAASISDFVAPLLRRDLFDYYFVAYNDSVLMDELNLSNTKISIPESGLEVTDSTANGKLTQYGYINEVEIGGKRYKLFTISFIAESNRKFSLGGYMPFEKYEDEKKYIPGNATLWLFLGLLIVTLMVPLLKIFLMNRSEQLRSRNVLTSLMCVHLLGSILIIILVNLYAYFVLIRGRSDAHLKTLAQSIQNTFGAELQDAIDEIDNSEKEVVNIIGKQKLPPGQFPELYRPTDLSDSNRNIYLLRGNAGTGDSIKKYSPEYLGNNYKFFENISWADSSGQQVMRWTNNAYYANKFNVRQRDYFQAVMTNSLLKSANGKPYYLTGVSSWVSQKKLVVISRPSGLNKLKGAATGGTDSLGRIAMVSLSSPFHSIFNPIMPYGFGFCIVDKRGDVFFHYDEKRSLNENLLEECNDDRHLNSLLNTGSSGIFDAHYTGTNHRFYLQPMEGLPYYIVTFYDIENIWNEDLDVMSASSIFVMINMGVILLLVFITRVFAFKRLSREILFVWVEPKSHRWKAYGRTSAGFVASAVLLLLFYLLNNETDGLYLLGMVFSFSHVLIAYSYYIYTTADKLREEGKIIKTYNDADEPGYSLKNWGAFTKPPLLILGILYVLACTLFVLQLDAGWGKFIFAQVLLLGTLAAIIALPPLKRVKINYKSRYQWSLASFILATGIIPTILFFSLSFKEEQQLSIKYRQVDFVNSFLERKPFLYPDTTWKLSYRLPFYIQSFVDTVAMDTSSYTPPRLVTKFGMVYSAVKPSFSTYGKRIEYLNPDEGSSGSFNWDATRATDSLKLWFNVLKTNTFAHDSRRISAATKLPGGIGLLFYDFRKNFLYFFFLVVGIALALVGLFTLNSFLVRRIFLFSKTNVMSLDALGEQILKKDPAPGITRDLSQDINYIYFIGIINSGKNFKIRNTFADCKIHQLDIAWLVSKITNSEGENLYQKEFKTITDDLDKYTGSTEDKQPRLVLIRHFEMQMNDLAVTEEKIKAIEILLSYRTKKPSDNDNFIGKTIKIFISSSRHYDALYLKGALPDKTEVDYTDRWVNIMNNFCTFYHKWQEADKTSIPAEPSLEKQKATPEEFFAGIITRVNNECAHSEFLFRLREPMRVFLENESKKYKNLRETDRITMGQMTAKDADSLFESFCVKLQGIAYYYYLSLWQSLSDAEQRTLYDIATDGLMNLSNSDLAENLYGLGLIRINENLTGYTTMNESFRLFVLTRLDKKEMDKLRSEADPGHSLNRIQLPVALVVVGIGVFLFVTQKDAFNNLVAYLVAAAAGIGALLKALDAFSNPKPATT